MEENGEEEKDEKNEGGRKKKQEEDKDEEEVDAGSVGKPRRKRGESGKREAAGTESKGARSV